ncbi:MAG TPA: glycerophosphoryl diester phosphodiesterase membrane domain-containing protein [Kineosporiaceae bacterium]|nr:glycerophosphoryl diester phosphodiesterase membrane domain-containing protein [Kineosporiaceae bacterium]
MTQPPAGGTGVPGGEASGWRAPEGDPPPPAGLATGPAVPGAPSQWGQVPQPSWGSPPPAGWGPPARPPAGIVPLRPLTVGEILDGSFQAVRSNARTMVGTAAAVVAGVTVVSLVPQALLLDRIKDNPYFSQGAAASISDQVDALAGLAQARAVPTVLTFVAVTMLQALLIVPVSEAVLGRRIDVGEMWRRARGRLLAALGLSLLTGLLVALAGLAVLVPGVVALLAGASGLGALLLVVGVAGAVVVALLLWVRWALAAPALVLEHAPVTTAMRRSWRLVGGSAWRVFGILLLAGIIVSIGQAVITVPVGILAGLPAAGEPSQYADLGLTFVQLLISGVGTIVAGAVFYPFSAAVSALLYIDLRMRREGLDVRLARAAAASSAQAGPV